MASKAEQVLASTFCMREDEVAILLYQDTKTKLKIYTIGDNQFTTSRTDLRSKGWAAHHDQYAATKRNTTLWCRRNNGNAI